jgi:hypothetical protein
MERRHGPKLGAVTTTAITVLLVMACTGATIRPSPGASAAGSAAALGRNPAAYLVGTPYAVTIDPADFVAVIDNLYWPMARGMTTVFEGDRERIVVEVTDEVKVVLGVPTTVVRDRAYDGDDRLIEDTFDWYAQDRWGNVWYFGEDTTEFRNGKPVSTAGSWEAGVDGALPGIVMLADPMVGDVYRNEYLAGEAEDLAKVLDVGGSITVPAGAFSETIVTEDWTPLEPGQLEHKTYAPGVGLVAEGPVDAPTSITLREIRQP